MGISDIMEDIPCSKIIIGCGKRGGHVIVKVGRYKVEKETVE